MATLATTRMSSKGQIVIPEEIRDRLGLQTGTQFVVVGDRDVVILKAISAPSMKEFDNLRKCGVRLVRKCGVRLAILEFQHRLLASNLDL